MLPTENLEVWNPVGERSTWYFGDFKLNYVWDWLDNQPRSYYNIATFYKKGLSAYLTSE